MNTNSSSTTTPAAAADDSAISIGAMMEPVHGLFAPSQTIAEATEQLRELVKTVFVTYGWVCDDQGRLLGVLTTRDLLLGDRSTRLDQVMIKNPFSLRPETSLVDAMREVVTRHYPIYPVCDTSGKLVGLIRGQKMFEAQAIEISAQTGAMVGVSKEERLATPWLKSLVYRHPWLQLNLLTAFIAAGVVAFFQGTLDSLVILAVFLPVLAGQSGNTGCQALAVALRGMTLGELKRGRERTLVIKEALLGLANGALVGITAGIGMYIFARMQPMPEDPTHIWAADRAFLLATITFAAMICSCMISGLSGAFIPLTLKKLGADPATASSIFLTTATDVASMGIFLGLATMFIHK
ncbi:MAG: magnesium transporter [Phycisphaerales bacterium]|nr:magnesium transporter [Phycisphaerales bacterium]